MITEGMSNRQLALKLAVEAYGERTPRHMVEVERLADKFHQYLETGTMGR